MNFLALDQATTTGWAVTDDTGNILGSGIWHLADKKRTGESRGMRYIRFEAELKRAIETWHPDVIIHEQTLLRGGAATEIANGLKALILKASCVYGLEVSCVHACELKHWATGSGKAKKSDMIKAADRYLVSAGLPPPEDDNQADAVLIGLWASSKYGTFPTPEWPSAKKKPRKRKTPGVVQEDFGLGI